MYMFCKMMKAPRYFFTKMIYFLNFIYAISGVFFLFNLIINVEKSFVNALYGLRITDLNLTFLRGTFTVDSSTPTLR
jgi:hypothetical protein